MSQFAKRISRLLAEIRALKTGATKSLANVTSVVKPVTISPTFYKTSDGTLDEVGIPTIHVSPATPPAIATATLAGEDLEGRGFLIQDIDLGNGAIGFKVLMEASASDGEGMAVGDRKTIPIGMYITATGDFSTAVTYEQLIP